MLLVVEGDIGGVQLKEMPDLVGHIGAHLVVSAILKPNFKKSLLGP